jgi:hypothetical protein
MTTLASIWQTIKEKFDVPESNFNIVAARGNQEKVGITNCWQDPPYCQSLGT